MDFLDGLRSSAMALGEHLRGLFTSQPQMPPAQQIDPLQGIRGDRITPPTLDKDLTRQLQDGGNWNGVRG